MKVWNEDGKTLTKEYLDKHWELYWEIHNKQRAKLNAAILAINAVGSRGAEGVLEEMEKMESLVFAYQELVSEKEKQRVVHQETNS